MKKAAVLTVLLIPGLLSAAFAVEATGSFAEAKAMAVESGKPLLVDFSTSW